MRRFRSLLFFLALAAPAFADQVTVTVRGTYQYTGNLPSQSADFTLSWTMDRNPVLCGDAIVCDQTPVVYKDGPVNATLNPSVIRFRTAGNGGGFTLGQDGLALNRLGFNIESSQLFTGPLGNISLANGVYQIVPGNLCGDPHFGLGNICSYAGQGFASGDVSHNPFQDPISLQSDDPILDGTITIASVSDTPEPASLALLGSGLIGLGAAMRRKFIA